MIFKSRESQCIFEILKELNKKEQFYNYFFKKLKSNGVKFSHSTIQNSIKKLIDKDFIAKEIKVKLRECYVITNNGKDFLMILQKVKEF